MKITIVNTALTAALMILLSGNIYAQTGSVLSSGQHPLSPEYTPVFPDSILPLDTQLSWTKRFNGDETFSEAEVLAQSVTLPGAAEMDHSGHSNGMSSMSSDSMKMDAMGSIKQIKADQGKIKIKHGPIDRLGMPAMTMMFKVEDVAMLENLEKGQEVGFSVDNTSGGFVVTHIMSMSGESAAMLKTDQNTSGDMDAQGVIQTIRLEQGKIKIKHGPIDRLGMPAMTMMFKVDNPEQLQGLVKGEIVDFSVDNSSGGFVITNIKPNH